VRHAFDAIDALLVDGEGDRLADLALEGLRALRDHAVDAGRVVALVGGHEGDGVAGSGLDVVRLEDHDAVGALVEHLHLMVGRMRGAGQHQGGKGRRDQGYLVHFLAFLS